MPIAAKPFITLTCGNGEVVRKATRCRLPWGRFLALAAALTLQLAGQRRSARPGGRGACTRPRSLGRRPQPLLEQAS